MHVKLSTYTTKCVWMRFLDCLFVESIVKQKRGKSFFFWLENSQNKLKKEKPPKEKERKSC